MTQVFPLSEGVFTIGHDKVFQPFDIEKEDLNSRPSGSLLVEVQPFAVVTEEDVLLLDTGLGFRNKEGTPQLEANLKKHSLHPEDVTKILLSHLHKDHAGGINLSLFPNASFYVHQAEIDYAQEVGFPSYHAEDFEPLLHSDRVVWLEDEAGMIGEHIRYERVGGHCPAHLAFWIETPEGTLFFGGDNAPQIKQLKMRYVAKYDYDGEKAMQLRKEWAQKGREEKWRFLFYHDVKQPTGILAPEKN